MSDYGVTDNGFVLKRLADIKLEQETTIQEIWTDANISGESVFGQIIGLYSDALAQVWESFQLVSNQYNPSNSSGPNLSSLVQLNGLTRIAESYGTVTLSLTGTDGTVIGAGSRVCNDANTIYYDTDEAVTIADGVATVTATAEEAGETECLSGTLTTIVNPITGWLTVTNAEDAETGTDVETDTELRARRDISTLAPSQSVVESIYSNLLDTEGVEFARVYVNESSEEDSRGIPSHSIACVVVGGEDAKIAEMIHNRKPAGIKAYGSTTEYAEDDQGFSYPIQFTRPTDVDISIVVTLTKYDDYPVDGDDQIISNILLYASGGADELGAVDFGNQDGFPPGDDVLTSRIYTPLNSVDGHNVTSLSVYADDRNTTDGVIEIAWNEVSAWDSSRITITATDD